MAAEVARGRELAQLVPDHVLGHVDRDMAAPIVDADRVTGQLRKDRARARPGLDHFLARVYVHELHLAEQLRVDVPALLGGATHILPQRRPRYDLRRRTMYFSVALLRRVL